MRYLSSPLIMVVLLALSLSAAAQSHKTKAPGDVGLDKLTLQKVADGWSTLNPADAAKFYDHDGGPFFDITPLRYSTWDEYENGVRKILANYQSIKFTVNDDAVVHVLGNLAWGAATLKEEAVLKNGKHEMATLRWTAIWEKKNGAWRIVHDHTSEPLQ